MFVIIHKEMIESTHKIFILTCSFLKKGTKVSTGQSTNFKF